MEFSHERAHLTTAHNTPLGNDQCKTTASKPRPNKHFMRGLTKLSEYESSELKQTDPMA